MWTTQVKNQNGETVTVTVLNSSAGIPTVVRHNNRTLEINWGNQHYFPVN